jgi:hypothetical protein
VQPFELGRSPGDLLVVLIAAHVGEPAMTEGRKLKSKRRAPPEPRLFDHGDTEALTSERISLRFHPDSSRAPHLLMRVGPRDVSHALDAISAGAKPSAVVSGLNETEDFTSEVRRGCASRGVDWICDPQLWKTALEGYRSSPRLQALDYTPGRHADPYTAEEFEDRGFLARIARQAVGHQFDVGANAPLTGAFVARAPADPWLKVTAEMIRVGLSQRDALGPRPLIATVPLELSGFLDLDAQRELIRTLSKHRPDAYLLMLSGLHEDSSAERLVAALRLALLLQEAGAPVILGRAGMLRHLFLAFGVRGIEFGLGRLLRFSLPDYKSKGGGGGPARFELPSLLAAAAPQLAHAALAADILPESDCACPACRETASSGQQIAVASEHAAHTVCTHAGALDGLPTVGRVAALKRSVGEAGWRWQELRVAKITESYNRKLWMALRRKAAYLPGC